MSSFKKLKEELSSKEKFYSQLTDNKISDKECEHVIKILDRLEMKAIKHYHKLYVKCNVLLLADVFEKFRNKSLKNYGLCPRHYISVPA